MPLPDNWAKAEDFATLFQYFWYRDFPMHQSATGARRSDWTIHIGLVVRSIADLMGLVTRFESGNRKDAVLRSGEGDEIAIEWEGNGVGVPTTCHTHPAERIRARRTETTLVAWPESDNDLFPKTLVEMTNLSPIAWADVRYVADFANL